MPARGWADAPSDEGRPSSAPLASRGARLMDRPYAVSDTKRILVARGLRAFGDGFVALLVPIYLIELGFSPLAIGAIVTSTLVGTALLTLWVGMVANRYSVRRLLLASALLMAATGAGFAVTTALCPLQRHWLAVRCARHLGGGRARFDGGGGRGGAPRDHAADVRCLCDVRDR